MKKLLLLLSFAITICFLVWSCSKSSSSFTYAINGIADVTLKQLDSFSLPIQIEKQTGSADNVSLSISGLPAGVTATITPASGKPNYNATIKFVATSTAVVGTSLITLTGTSTAAGSKPYNFHLVITTGGCAAVYAGNYSYFIGGCSVNTVSSTTAIVTTDATNGNRIHIANFMNNGSSIYADLDCSAHTLSVPAQSINSSGNLYTLTGSGNFNAGSTGDSIAISYNLTGSSGTDNCVIVIIK